MKKYRKQQKHHLKTTKFRNSSRAQIEAMRPEDLVVHMHRAEKEVLPIIRKRELSPAAAQFLLAQYTYVFATGKNQLSTESAMQIATTALSLWQDGLYVPSTEYPFTLEETLQEIHEGPRAKKDYSEYFQAYAPLIEDQPQGIGHVSGGIVKHPETSLWQIWLIVDGTCMQLGGYHESAVAQGYLDGIICEARRGGIGVDVRALYEKIQSQASGSARNLSFDMMMYLLEHLDLYTIRL